jgi:hypothetical protein
MTVKISEEITKENYHFLLSAAEAKKSYPEEYISIDVRTEVQAMRLCLRLIECGIEQFPNYLEFCTSMYLTSVKTLKSLPEHLFVFGNLYIDDTIIEHIPETIAVNGLIYVSQEKVEKIKKLNPKFEHLIKTVHLGLRF